MPTSPTNKTKGMDTTVFIKEIADRLFLPEETIQAVWDTSTKIITEALLREERVIIRRFGVFRLSQSGRARFRASGVLKQILKEKAMEKLGVEMDNEAILMAKITGACPACKSNLAFKDPPQCPNCGTAPFEKPPRKKVEFTHTRIDQFNQNFNVLYGKKDDAKE